MHIATFAANGNGSFEKNGHHVSTMFIDDKYNQSAWKVGVKGYVDVVVTGINPVKIQLVVDGDGKCTRQHEPGVKQRFAVLQGLID